MKMIQAALILGILGLIVGYGIFGQINGNYVELGTLFGGNGGVVDSVVSKVAGFDTMRSRILISGLAGAVLGLVIVSLTGKK